MSKLSLSVFLVLLTGCAAHDWTPRDTALEITFQALNAIDAEQTSRISEHPSVVEGNSITEHFIGDKPSDRDVAVYFTSVAVSHYLIARWLPKKWRPWFQGLTLYHTGSAVAKNEENGL